MKVRLKPNLLVVTGETPEEVCELAAWANQHDDHAFRLMVQDPQTFRLTDLGPQRDACREPINVVSTSIDLDIRLISNFAATPFEFDGRSYASVEGFWQGLKFPDAAKRREIAGLSGSEAKRVGAEVPNPEMLDFAGRTIRTGSPEHWDLMSRACWAKFSQHPEAQRALLATGERPLTHRVRRDSRTIPGAIMAEIWMRVRRGLHKQLDAPAEELLDETNEPT